MEVEPNRYHEYVQRGCLIPLIYGAGWDRSKAQCMCNWGSNLQLPRDVQPSLGPNPGSGLPYLNWSSYTLTPKCLGQVSQKPMHSFLTTTYWSKLNNVKCFSFHKGVLGVKEYILFDETKCVNTFFDVIFYSTFYLGNFIVACIFNKHVIVDCKVSLS